MRPEVATISTATAQRIFIIQVKLGAVSLRRGLRQIVVRFVIVDRFSRSTTANSFEHSAHRTSFKTLGFEALAQR